MRVESANLERMLRDEQIRRPEQSYGQNLVDRQNMINHAVIDFAADLLVPNGLILDACCGPEGSYPAANAFNLRWIGNDISKSFLNLLNTKGASVVLSDSCTLPYKDASFDAALFVFALNNMFSMSEALREAKRVVRPNGIIIESEPGISSWVGKIVLHSLLKESSSASDREFLVGRNSTEEIETQFQGKPYLEREYVDNVLNNKLGITRSDTLNELRQIIGTTGKAKVFFKFQQYLIGQYFQHLNETISLLNLSVVRSGLLITTEQANSSWRVYSPIKTENTSWLENLAAVRQWDKNNSIVQALSKANDDEKTRIVASILCIKK